MPHGKLIDCPVLGPAEEVYELKYKDGSVVLNRHDRKRGMQPWELTCRNCKADLGRVAITAFNVATVLEGYLELGREPGTVVVRAHAVYGERQEVICGECGAVAHHLIVVDYFTEEVTDFFEAVEDEHGGTRYVKCA